MNAPATQADGGTLTKPADWAVFMVTAALKCASDEKIAATYTSPDEAKHNILKTLNWFEAHDEYEWPDFSRLKFDFAQIMRLRRALVQDVFNALEQAGNIKIGVHGTPDSNAGTRRGRRSDGEGGRRMTERKRLCKRDVELQLDALSEHFEGLEEDHVFLLDILNHLMSRSKLDISQYLDGNPATRDTSQLADMLHDRLVMIWDGPLRDDSEQQDILKQKAETWDRLRRSVPPKPSQRERTATPRVSPVAPQASPATVQKPTAEPTASPKPARDMSGGWTAANKWANTNTMC